MREPRILIAEDNLVLRKVLAKQIEQLGYCCDVAENGVEALKLIAESNTPYDLIISDLNMPEMGGFELVATIRKLEEANGHPRLPVVAITAYANITRTECLSAGFDEFYEKPVTTATLQTITKRWVGGVYEPTG